MKKSASILIFVAPSLSGGSPAMARAASPGVTIGFPLEVTEDGKLIYGGDSVYACESVGAAITMPAGSSIPETRAESRRTNERAIELRTEAGFPPAGTEGDALPETGGYPPVACAAVAIVTSFVLMRRFVR